MLENLHEKKIIIINKYRKKLYWFISSVFRCVWLNINFDFTTEYKLVIFISNLYAQWNLLLLNTSQYFNRLRQLRPEGASIHVPIMQAYIMDMYLAYLFFFSLYLHVSQQKVKLLQINFRCQVSFHFISKILMKWKKSKSDKMNPQYIQGTAWKLGLLFVVSACSWKRISLFM